MLGRSGGSDGTGRAEAPSGRISGRVLNARLGASTSPSGASGYANRNRVKQIMQGQGDALFGLPLVAHGSSGPEETSGFGSPKGERCLLRQPRGLKGVGAMAEPLQLGRLPVPKAP